ncbi:unnamed protein product [Protopolystoma xenopodis]|uniref:EF-hand domain-containing protein n=1 Tax=Protopolystoma xenopodis TaxID=117903 RepID=A0A448WJJ1_9PLAT|nr:unnamed protein product [Protopolystoma xenopodis]
MIVESLSLMADVDVKAKNVFFGCNSCCTVRVRQDLFTLVDATGGMSYEGLSVLLHECIQLPRQLGEAGFFGGSNVEPSVKNCFRKVRSG